MNYKIFKKIKIFLFFLVTITIIFNLSGCKKSKFDKLISYSFLNTIKNLDPQTAIEPEEITIISNIFEGLYKKDLKNGYKLGIAKEIKKTDDEKTLIFTLKDNIFWHSYKENSQKIKVTADDFIFAFKRLIDKNTNSMHASNYFFIKNAQKINEGKLPLDKLGVYKDENNNFVMELEYKTPFLEELLCKTPAMPCNEDFFKSTAGQYGTTKEHIISNGPFFLNAWGADKTASRIKIRKSNEYYDKNFVKIIGVNFSVRSKEDAFNLFKEKETKTAIVDANQLNILNKNSINNIPFQNKVSGIIFNENNSFFSNEKTKIALANSINRNKLEEKLQASQTIANNIIPNSITIFGKPYNKIKPREICCPQYNPGIAKEYFEKAYKETKKNYKNFDLNSKSILIKNSANEILNQQLQSWQRDFNMFLKIDAKDNEKYEKMLKEGDFDCALVTFYSKFNNPSSILKNFSTNSPFNYSGYDIKNFDLNLNSANTPTEYFELEKFLCQRGYFIPLYFETEYFVYDNKLQNIIFDPANKEFYYGYCESK